jgi:aspartate aminotransferase
VTYKDVVHYAGAKCVFVETDEAKGFTLTAAMVEPYVTAKTKMMIFNSPSNPSGGVVSKTEAAKLLELARKRNFWMVTDECYDRFLYEDEPFSMAAFPGAKDIVCVTASLSKTYAMTGWRIGFTLTPKYVSDAISKLQSHSTSNPTSIAQKAAVEALLGPQESVGQMLGEYRRRREYVIGRLRRIPGVRAQEPKGAFYAYPNISCTFGHGGINSAMDFAEKLLAEEAVALVPGEAFGTTQHVRISYATSMQELERGLDRIEKFIRTYSA